MVLEGSYVQLRAIGPLEHLLYDIGPATSRADAIRPFSECVPRHTRFARETRREPFPEAFRLGKSNAFQIPRAGDLLGDIFLEITLPSIVGAPPGATWVDSVGHVLLRRVMLKIDDTTIHDQERLWYDLEDALFLKQTQQRGIDELIGRNSTLLLSDTHTLIIPLKLFFCKRYHSQQNFLPLLGIPGSTITLTIEAESYDNLVVGSNTDGHVKPVAMDARLVTDFYFVEAPEKERLLLRPTSILFEDVQDVESYSYVESTDALGGAKTPVDFVRLSMQEVNAPVKLLVWVVYNVRDAAQKLYFQYQDVIRSVELKAETVSLVDDLPSGYYARVQKFYHVDNSPKQSNVHVYSFALDASSWQPSGQLNFDQVARPELQCKLKEKRADLVIKAFVMTYKHLIFDKGRAMLKFI